MITLCIYQLNLNKLKKKKKMTRVGRRGRVTQERRDKFQTFPGLELTLAGTVKPLAMSMEF